MRAPHLQPAATGPSPCWKARSTGFTTDEEAEARYVVECTCGSDEFAAAVGFNFYDDSPTPDIRWVGIAVRCTADGLIGYCASWKIGYGPSRHLLDAV